MAHILINEAKYPITQPKMETLEIIKETDDATVKAENTTANK